MKRVAAWKNSARTPCRTRARIPCARLSKNSGPPFPGCSKPPSCSSWSLGKYRRSFSDHRRSSRFQRRSGIFSGKPRAGNSRRAEVAAGDDRVRPPRWGMDERARRRAGAGRCREDCRWAAWFPRMRSSQAERSCSINPCSRASPFPSRPARAARPMRGRWCGAARRWRKSRRPERAPNSARPPNSSSPLMSSARSRRRSCASCAIWPRSTASSSWGSRSTPLLLKMPIAEIVPLILTAVLASIPVALPATFTLAAALGRAQARQARRPSDAALRGG